MRKTGKLLLYVSLIAVVLIAIYSKVVFEFAARLTSSKEGLLISLYNHVTQYFAHADSLNLIFLVVFGCISLVACVMIDNGLLLIFKWAVRYWRIENRILSYSWITVPLHKFFSLFVLVISFILLCNVTIIWYGEQNSIDSLDQIQTPYPVLILGTSKMLRSGIGGENLYYSYRIESAVNLWKSDKVLYFIVSGDRSGDHYDETRDIMKDLILRGVPADRIQRDTAGYRTLDSMLRIREMYRTQDIIIVSQPFHIQRALFLAKFYGMNGLGFKAQGGATLRMFAREFLVSKPKVVMDLIFFNMQPRVSVNNGSTVIQYREEFKVTTDLHVLFLVVLAVAVLSSLGLAYKYID